MNLYKILAKILLNISAIPIALAHRLKLKNPIKYYQIIK